MRFRDLLTHLRLHWQVLLMPLFLWGFMLAERPLTLKAVVIFLLFHVLFYGGATALNSYFDKDEGPVGGLWRPPPVTRALFTFAVGLQIAGLIVLAGLNRPLLWLALVMGALGNGYSIPGIRLKARPWTSLLAVGIGQGMGGTLAGWLTATESWASALALRPVLGMLIAGCMIMGFYPLTQVYQRAEDLARGDITFAVRWGRQTFLFAMGFMLAGAALLGRLLSQTAPAWMAALAVAGVLGMVTLVYRWWRRFDESRQRENYQEMMRQGYLMTAGFVALIVGHVVFR